MKTYRDAVRACWEARTRTTATKRQLAEEAGLYVSHVTDYMNEDPSKRELPAKHIAAFEAFCQNHLITLWLVERAGLKLAEPPAAGEKA